LTLHAEAGVIYPCRWLAEVRDAGVHRGKNKPESQNEANRARARYRAPGERANAQLKN